MGASGPERNGGADFHGRTLPSFRTDSRFAARLPPGHASTVEDLYRTISLGLSGSGMPAWERLLPVRDRWAFVYHVAEL